MDLKQTADAVKESGSFFLKKVRGMKFGIIIACAALLLIAVAGFGAAFVWRQIYVPLDKNSADYKNFSVKKGDGVKEIAQKLEEEKIIRSAFWFEIDIWRKNQGSDLQAGEYSLSSGLSISQVGELITGGKIIPNEVSVTLPEGFNLRQIRQRMFESNLTESMYLGEEKVGNYQLQYKFLADVPVDSSLEGFLFPDTYRFKFDVSSGEIVKRFLENFDKKLTPALREEISRQGKNLYQVLIMASIVQAEALNEEEMPMISGIFWNRLNIGMKLQSDATVNYVTGKSSRQPSYEDLETASSFNTYLHEGLPPAPICNPGIVAIKAAIYPATSDYYYFLHPVGFSAVYSKTAEEHGRNVSKYLK